MSLYKVFARDLAQLIQTGALKAGERLPSVRTSSKQRGVSVSTVLQAYHLLEAQGFVQAAERSGFRVSEHAATCITPRLTTSTVSPLDSIQVDKSALIAQVLHSLKREGVVPMGSAFPDPHLFPQARLTQSLTRSMRQLDPARAVMDIAPGNPALIRQIALRYHLQGFALDAEELVICNGAMEALMLCLQAVTRPGDSVVIESPGFYVCLQALERLDLKAIEVKTSTEQGIDLQELELAIEKHRPAAIWLMSNFQNPLGSLMPIEAKKKLAALLHQHQTPLVEDDVYGELYFDEHRPPPIKAFDRDGLVLHCGSFSKCLAPGYRIGWAAAGRFGEQVQALKLSTSLSAALPSELAITDYLETGAFDTHLRALRLELESRRDSMLANLRAKFPTQCRISVPQGGYFLWLELPGEFDSFRLYQVALQHGISIAPGNLFTVKKNAKHSLRLNYGHPSIEEAEAAIARLAHLLPLSRL